MNGVGTVSRCVRPVKILSTATTTLLSVSGCHLISMFLGHISARLTDVVSVVKLARVLINAAEMHNVYLYSETFQLIIQIPYSAIHSESKDAGPSDGTPEGVQAGEYYF